MSDVLFERKRQAFGSQIREALEDMKAKELIHADGFEATNDGRQLHKLVLTPGQLADLLNAVGNYDIHFGRA